MTRPTNWISRVSLLALVAPLWIMGIGVCNSPAADDDRTPSVKHFDDQIKPFLARHCLECHVGAKPKGDFRLDKLAPDFAGAGNREKWSMVLERISC